jgi:hypothetical protein
MPRPLLPCRRRGGDSDRSFHHGSDGEPTLLHYVRQCVADRAARCNASPNYWAHFEVVHFRLRENALDTIANVVRVRHADVSRKTEVLDDDPPELGLREGEGFNNRDCEEREPSHLAEPFDQPHVFCDCGAGVGS